MSTVENHEQDTETRLEAGLLVEEPGVLLRTYEAKITPGDGRTVDVRIVPYGERITHNDGLGGVPKGVPYEEEWAPGVFAHQERAANRVLANFEHQQTLSGVIGHGLVLREGPDGFYGSFKMHETPDGDKALMLVREGVLEGVSVEARPVRNVRTDTGVVRRVKAHLHAIAFTRFPAYASAKVLAVREVPVTTFDEDMLPVEADPELIARCRRLGIAVPQHLEAHPDESGTQD